MKNYLAKYGFTITTDPLFQNKSHGIPPELDRQLDSLAGECQKPRNKKVIDKLTHLIEKYPEAPMLKNYLTVAYNFLGMHPKATEINNWALKEHPGYLFARINKAHECIQNSEPGQVPVYLGEALEIKELYPERDIFHLTEVACFFSVAVRYFLAIDNIGLAEKRLAVLEEVAPGHHQTKLAEDYLTSWVFKKTAENLKEENDKRIQPKTENWVPKLLRSTPPKFNHPEINELYNHNLGIPHEILRKILALPRKTLIADLEMVLQDAIDRYGHYSMLENDMAKCSFPLHAIYLLSELNAAESLTALLNFLEKDTDFLLFWLGDHKMENLWAVIYKLGFHNFDVVKQFLLKPGIDSYSKVAASEALCQVVLHYPERKEAVIKLFNEVFNGFLYASDDDNLIDSDFLGMTLNYIIDSGLKELLPIIKLLFDKDYIGLSYAGDYISVVEEFKKTLRYDPKRKILSIYEVYEDIVKNWVFDNDDHEEDQYPHTPATPTESVKVGRNDPCPCGSGKKYKKCCLK